MNRHENLRKHDRIDTLLEASFSDGQRMYVDAILNLGMGGACVECQKPIEKGTHVTIIIPSNPAVRIGASVRWCTKNRLKHKIGLEFDELLPDQKRALNEFMRTFFWDRAK